MAELLVTNKAREQIARFLAGETISAPGYIALGFSSTEAAITDEELGDEYYRAKITARFRIEPDVTRFVLTLPSAVPPKVPGTTNRFREAGLFDAGPITLSNPNFESWTDTTLDGWVIENATVTKEITDIFEGQASAKVSVASGEGLVYQNIPNPENYRGKKLIVRAAGKRISSYFMVFIEDDAGRYLSSYFHTSWSFRERSAVISSTTTSLKAGFLFPAGDGIIDWANLIECGNLYARCNIDIEKDVLKPLSLAFHIRLLSPEEETVMPLIAFAKEELTISTTVKTLTSSVYQPANQAPAEEAVLTSEDGDLRYWMDSSDPTSSSGHLLTPGLWTTIRGLKNISQLKMIRAGTTDAKIQVTYFR